MTRTVILRLLDTYFRHRWLYLIPIGLMAIAAVIYLVSQQRLYISSGIVFTERDSLLSSLTSVDQAAASWNTPAQDTANQISELIQTDAFIRAVISETDLEPEMSKEKRTVEKTISKVRSHLWVWAGGTNQVQITAADTDPHIAYQLAQSAINTFILWNINLDRTDSTTAEFFFQGLIQNYQANVLSAREALRKYFELHPEPLRGNRPDIEEFEIQSLQSQLDFAETRLDHAMEKAEDARLANAQIEGNVRQKYTVVDAPNISDRSTTSKRKMALDSAIFLAVGMLLSVIAIVGTTMFDQSLRIPAEVPQLLNLPILTFLPDISAPAPKRSWRRKTKELMSDTGEEILLGKPEEVLTLPAAVPKKLSRKEKKKMQAASETSEVTAQNQDQASDTFDPPV